MHHPTDRIAHTTAFVTPVVEHWLEREIAQWVQPMKDRSDDPSHHERTLLPRSYILLLWTNNARQCNSFLFGFSVCVFSISGCLSSPCCIQCGPVVEMSIRGPISLWSVLIREPFILFLVCYGNMTMNKNVLNVLLKKDISKIFQLSNIPISWPSGLLKGFSSQIKLSTVREWVYWRDFPVKEHYL